MTMAGFGIVQAEIARTLDIDPKTLRRAFRRELDIGMTDANARVAESLFQMAVRDKVPSAAIFWLKVRAGWRDHDAVSIGGDGSQIVVMTGVARGEGEVPTIEGAVLADAEDRGDAEDDSEAGHRRHGGG
jgi:hypothetical protein